MRTNNNLTHLEILKKGWQSLVTALGPENAQEFIFSFPKKEKDSVKYWKNFWGSKSINQIHKRIIKSK
tara:strand:- start:2723 stop:2926 length:204 start_codon:yes stop_codon:yes gene_type:complete